MDLRLVRTCTLLAIVGVVTALSSPGALGAPRSADGVAGEVVVGISAAAGPGERAALARRTGVRLVRRVTTGGVWLARARGGRTTDQVIARLEADAAVRWAEPNYVYRQLLAPDDPLFESQWGLLNTGQTVDGAAGTPGADIGVGAAWDRTTGSDRVRVAVVDTGIDRTHPDLAPNIGIVNPDEAGDGRETNGIDDDGNGLVDDWRGWDFSAGDADPQDESPTGHGTLVAGVLGARGNDAAGTAGVSWNSRILPIRGLNSQGFGTNANLAAAIAYGAARGARILNASFGGGAPSEAIREAITAAPNMLVVASSGNAGGDNDAFGRRGTPTFPCNLPQENVVCVGASDHTDALADFSNFGATSVDLVAPGLEIVGPRPGGGARPLNGTSFSAPHVSGVGALVLAENPGASTRQLRRALLEGVEALPSLTGRIVTGGRLDALGALDSLPAAEAGPGGESGPVADVTTSGARLTGLLPQSLDPIAYYFEYGATVGYGSVTPTRPLGPGAGGEVSEPIGRLAPATEYHARLRVATVAGITVGQDQVFTTRALPPPVVPPADPPPGPPAAQPPVSPPGETAGTPPPIARPTAGLLRRGRSWFLSVRFAEPVRVRVTLERRTAPASRAIRFRVVRRLGARSGGAGVRRLSLGSLATGRYRVTVTVVGARATATLVRRALVPAARP